MELQDYLERVGQYMKDMLMMPINGIIKETMIEHSGEIYTIYPYYVGKDYYGTKEYQINKKLILFSVDLHDYLKLFNVVIIENQVPISELQCKYKVSGITNKLHISKITIDVTNISIFRYINISVYQYRNMIPLV